MANNKDSKSTINDSPRDAKSPASAVAPILNYLLETRGFDFTGFHPDMLVRRISKRLVATATRNFDNYLAYLPSHEDELDRLIDVLTINVSRFFRDSLTFELLAERVLPTLIRKKVACHDSSLRIWSAGCAQGEEPYSVAILVQELLEKDAYPVELHLFATDIDPKALRTAQEAQYARADLEQMKYGFLLKYFKPEGENFRLIPAIQEKVHFSQYDILDKKHGTPPESVFGGFDLVLCRNLLIYFKPEYQMRIFEKLYHAIAPDGILILGEAETLPMTLRHLFCREFEFSPIYRKL